MPKEDLRMEEGLRMQEEKRPSNHEITKRRVMSGIASYDIQKAIRQFALVSDAQYLYVDFMTRHYRIDLKSGMTEWQKTGGFYQEASFREVLTIFDLLFYSKEDARLTGEYMLMQNLSGVQTSEIYAGKGGLRPYEVYWDTRTNTLKEACLRLGGVPAGKGDVAYRIPVFQNIDMIVQFWCSDEEFPPSFNFLFDENLMAFVHYETLGYIVGQFFYLLEA